MHFPDSDFFLKESQPTKMSFDSHSAKTLYFSADTLFGLKISLNILNIYI